MCIQTMVNDGGLEAVLQSSDRVWNELCLLHEKKLAESSSAALSAGADDATSARSKATMMASLFGSGGGGGSSRVLDLSQHSESELKRAVSPLIQEMEKLDAAALLSLDAISEDGKGSGKGVGGAVLDPKRGLTVMPIHDRVFPPCDNSCNDDDHDDEMEMNYNDDKCNNRKNNSNSNKNSTVRYLHVVDLPHKYSVGIFVFPPNARMPLHDHPNMIVLSRVLYGELQVQSYDIVHPVQPTSIASVDGDKDDEDGDADAPMSDNNNNTNAAVVDHHVAEDGDLTDESTNNADLATTSSFNYSPTRTPGVLQKSFTKIKDFLSMKIVSYSSHGHEDDDDDNNMQVDPVLYVRPNLNPVGTVRRRSSSLVPGSTHESSSFATGNAISSSAKVSNVGDDTGSKEDDEQLIISAPSVTCLFPREGNCHSFVAGPQGAALLDILLPPYDTNEVRDCTFYEVANEHAVQHHHQVHNHSSAIATTSIASSLKLTPIDQPDDFHCVSGSYGRFGACKNY